MTIREIIKNKNREFSVNEFTRKYISREVFTQDATERKIRAAEYFAPILKEKFGEKYPHTDWDKESAELAIICHYGPDDINKQVHFIPAIAIFIADSIFHSENGKTKIHDLEKLIDGGCNIENFKDAVEDNYYKNCEIEAIHSFYPILFLENLVEFIAFRDADYVNYEKTKASKYDSYSFVCSQYTSSLNKEKKESHTREVFDSIMGMVPDKDKDEAIEEFKMLFFVLIDRYLETKANIEKTEKKLGGKKENLTYILNDEFSSPFDPKKDKRRMELLDMLQNVTEELDNIDFNIADLKDNYVMGLFSLPNFIDKYSKPFESVPSFDPYKVIAGYFFLLERGDNYAWLLGASLAAIGYAGYLLPWSDISILPEELPEELDNEVNKHYWNNNDIYVPTIKKESMEIYDEIASDKISIAKAICLLTNTIPPRFNISVPFGEKVRNEIGDEMYRKMENYLNFVYTTNNKVRDTSNILLKEIYDKDALSSELKEIKGRLDTVENEKKKLEKETSTPDILLLEEIDSLKKKLSALNSALIEETREKESLKRKIEKERQEQKNMKEELYSLRELIFSRDEEQNEENEEPEIQFPYRTDSNITVIGGGPDWLKAIKNLLPDVKFYGDRAPQKEVLKHCDIVWFQTYAGLSHKTFYKTIDDIKAFNIPIKYSPTGGVHRSAEAIVKDDEERRK